MVGMSGGVDSSVAAALLIQQGYDVTGVTLKLWGSDDNIPEKTLTQSGCCSMDDVTDAKMTAFRLGIPHYVLNFKDLFRDRVVEYFINEYQQGKTPNPCIACNRYVKIGGLLPKALSMGFDYIATGHYAQILQNHTSGRFELHKGYSNDKDQSYVLYHFKQNQLAHTLFPLGELTKDQVRELAQKLALPTAGKKDSQEICFVPSRGYASFLDGYNNDPPVAGYFKDRKGNILGKHKGIAHYTIGQRKGLGIVSNGKLFVYAIEPETDTVYVGEEECLYRRTLNASECNFIAIPRLDGPMELQAKIRYNAQAAPGILSPLPDGRVRFDFKEPVRAVTPGQAAVFYEGDRVIGGGTIEEFADENDCGYGT
jgi:tRNA-uridine 2-sulfurtransferase